MQEVSCCPVLLDRVPACVIFMFFIVCTSSANQPSTVQYCLVYDRLDRLGQLPALPARYLTG